MSERELETIERELTAMTEMQMAVEVVPRLLAEVRRLRAMLIPMAEVLFQSSLRNGVGEYDEISVGRLTTSLGELRALIDSAERPDILVP